MKTDILPLAVSPELQPTPNIALLLRSPARPVRSSTPVDAEELMSSLLQLSDPCEMLPAGVTPGQRTTDVGNFDGLRLRLGFSRRWALYDD